MAQIVAGEKAVKGRELLGNQFALFAAAGKDGVIDASFRRLLLRQLFRQFYRHGAGVENAAAQQHRAQPQHVIGGFAVDQRTLPGGVGIDHAAQRGAVAGGKFRRKEVAQRLKIRIKLIFYHARLDAHPALLQVNVQNAVHIARHIHHDALIQRLAVSAGAATARGEGQAGERRAGGDAGDQRHVGGGSRKKHRVRQKLVNTVICGHGKTVSVAGGRITGETTLFQRVQK